MISRPAPVAPAKERASSHVRRLAKEVQRTFPDMTVHQHLTDAAREIDAGRADNAKRHLDAAISSFAPLQLIRHGIHDDEGHRAAKNFMQQAHRGRLLVQDVQHMQGENDGLMERHRDQAASALQARAMRNAQPQPVGRVDRAVAVPGTVAANPPAVGPGTAKQYANGPQPYRRGPDETVTCPYCGKGDAPDARYCDQCGRELPASAFADLSWAGIWTAIELAGRTPPHETMAGRRALRSRGQTAYGTSFPVPNLSYLRKAIHSIGRAPASKRGRLKSFLKRRASALGAPALTANLTADELAMIDLAVIGGQVIELVGPKGYEHGWKFVGVPGGGSKIKSTGIGGKLRHAASILSGGTSAEYSSRDWQKKHLTPQQISALRQNPQYNPATGSDFPGLKPTGQGERGRLGSAWHPGQAAETAASGAGFPLETRKVPAQHQQTYNALRATGHSHSAAMRIIGGIGGRIGKVLGAGSVTESITQYAWEDVLHAIELVGPKGYSHGWIFTGTPGSSDHVSALRSLASHADDTHRGTGAGDELRKAASSMESGDKQGTQGHLTSAYQKMAGDSRFRQGVANDSFHKAAAENLNAVKQHMRKTSGWQPGVHLSAQTGRLATEPHPFGKPGGPGLWNVKGMELPPYIQNIARALLRTGRAKDLSQAIAIAKGATNRWATGKNTSPEVRAASMKTNASWDAKRATAHAHSTYPYDWDHLVELTGTAAGAAKDPRIAAGQAGGGQFGSGGGAAAGGGKAAPQQSRAQRKAALLAMAKQDRAQAKLLLIRIAADRAALASASGKKNTGQKGATTKATASKTGTSAPAAKGAAKSAAAASPTSSKNTGLTPAQIAKATASAKTAAAHMSKQQLQNAIKTLTVQEKNLLAAAVKATQQASKL